MTKTTIRNIDPDALWDAKIYAAQTKQTLGEVYTFALQQLVYEEEGEGDDNGHSIETFSLSNDGDS